MTRRSTPELRSAAALERIASALERLANEREGVFIQMDDGTKAIPDPIRSDAIAARTPPVTTPAKRFGHHVEEPVKPLPKAERADALPSDDVEGLGEYTPPEG